MIFLGDSFTFGAGLNDDETFAFLYCQELRLNCANLGKGGTGTHRQLDILIDFLEKEKWRPEKVKLFLMIMTSSLMGGNDLFDNIIETQQRTKTHNSTGIWQHFMSVRTQIRSVRTQILEHSNLARMVYFTWGPMIRATFSPNPHQQILDLALDTMKNELTRFRDLGKKYNFQPEIYIIPPVQDLIWQTMMKTLDSIYDIAPEGMPILSVAPALIGNPKEHYYPFNGHLNSKGARRVAEFLVRSDGAGSRPSK